MRVFGLRRFANVRRATVGGYGGSRGLATGTGTGATVSDVGGRGMRTYNLGKCRGREYVLTDQHAASSYGQLVLVDLETGAAYGPCDTVAGQACDAGAVARALADGADAETVWAADRFACLQTIGW